MHESIATNFDQKYSRWIFVIEYKMEDISIYKRQAQLIAER